MSFWSRLDCFFVYLGIKGLSYNLFAKIPLGTFRIFSEAPGRTSCEIITPSRWLADRYVGHTSPTSLLLEY